MLARAKTRPRQQTVQSATLQAPTGGMNTIVAASELPDEDCIVAYNMVGSEYGLRSRLGYKEWALGLDGPGLSGLPFSGSQASGAADRLFWTTASGIWDCSASTASATRVLAFPMTSGLAGYGISHVLSTGGGHFLIYCDEANGMYCYAGATTTWTKLAAGTTQTWATQTFYTAGNRVVSNGNVYQVLTGGTSGTTYSPTGNGTLVAWAVSTSYAQGARVSNGGNIYQASVGGTSAATGSGPSGTGTGITDGTVTWAYVGPYVAGNIIDGTVTWNYVSAATTTGIIGPSLADQQNGLTLDPANFVFATVFKNRLWLLERNSSRLWYGNVNAFQGTFTSFDFGIKLSHGGPLAGIYNWAYDAGGGMDTRLVGISTAGDVVIYAGTDPTSASSFGLYGCWYVGPTTAGRRVATDYGGDLLINSSIGNVLLSKLVVVNNPSDQQEYTTTKIGNLFTLLINTYRTLPGWAIHIHPQDNALLTLVPQGASGGATLQLVYCFVTQSWSRYRDLPMVAAASWNGSFYFSTPDGRVCINSGYVDNVLLSNPNSYTPVNWSLVTRFENLGNANIKRVVMMEPTILSETPNPIYSIEARYDFDLSEASPPSAASGASSAGVWDVSKWDIANWSGDYTAAQPISGGLGMGRDVGIAIRGAADARTILVDIKVIFEQGGLL